MPPQPTNPSARRLAEEWLGRAERDLQAAQNELSVAVPLSEISVYHAQQAAEKAPKAFLSAHSVPFPHTHDLVQLQTLCQGIEPGFTRFLAAAQTLSPYATLFRYPGGPLAPPKAEAEQGVQLASGIVRFVREHL